MKEKKWLWSELEHMPRLSCRNKEYCTKRPHQLVTEENISNIVLRSVELAQTLMICVFLINLNILQMLS